MFRRRFIQAIMALAGTNLLPRRAKSAGDSLGDVLPLRSLGASGLQVTCLGLGGYHVGWTTEALAQATIEAAIEEGVRFFDTSESYGPHISEERYAAYLVPKYREHIFLMTKSDAKDASSARASIEGSLSRLKTDILDLWQMHQLESPEDVDARLDNGVLEEALKAQQEGKIRHLGFTGHARPDAHLRMLERTSTAAGHSPFTTCQLPVSAVDAASSHSFLATAVPALRAHGLGILAMKTLADGRFFGTKTVNGKTSWTDPDPVIPNGLTVAECIHFVLSLPVSVLITGAEKPEFVREKAALARSFQALDDSARMALIQKAASWAAQGRVEYYKAAAIRG